MRPLTLMSSNRPPGRDRVSPRPRVGGLPGGDIDRKMAVFAGLDVAGGDAQPGRQNKGEERKLSHTTPDVPEVPGVPNGARVGFGWVPSARCYPAKDAVGSDRKHDERSIPPADRIHSTFHGWRRCRSSSPRRGSSRTAPTIAGGFIKDDFAWVYHGRLNGWSSISPASASPGGFYRPLVQLTFSATEALFGTNPIPYALTNLSLGTGVCRVNLCAGARASVSRRGPRLPPPPCGRSTFTASTWPSCGSADERRCWGPCSRRSRRSR